MIKEQYNQLLFLKISGLASQLNQLVEEFKVEPTSENFDSFQKWQKLNSLHIALLDLQLEVGRDFHNQFKITSPESKSNKSFFANMSYQDYADLTKQKK
jgi:hypothetical protein